MNTSTGLWAGLPALPNAFGKIAVLLFLVIILPFEARAASGCDGAGNCYIYAGAAGSGNGASWANAFTGFGTSAGQVNPASMTRGVTYWIANGSYGGMTFSTPDSGTALISIMGATPASHGPAADWSNSYAGQATFGESSVTTDYWTFNGQSRGADWQSGYTIKFWNQSNPGGASVHISANNLTFKYVEMEGTGAGFPNNNSTADHCNQNNCGVWADNAIYASTGVSNLYVGYSYAHHTGNTQFQMNSGVSNNATWEYNWVSYNHTGQNGQHDEAYAIYASNFTVRYNVFQDISGCATICDAGANTPPLQNWAVYGNLIFWDSTYAALAGQYWEATIDDAAIVGFLGENMTGYVYVANNTVAGLYNAVADRSGTGFSTLPISGLVGYSTGSPNVTIVNNLWYGSAYVYGDYTPYCSVVSCASLTQDYNASYQGIVPSGDNWQTNSTPGAHDYNVSGSSASPFVNNAASTIAGFKLTTPDPFISNPGATLQAPYNIDGLNGVNRGANGTWDRGAEQLGNSTLAPPTNLTGTVQ